MAEEFMIFRGLRENADAKRGVGKALFDSANELYDFLTQRVVLGRSGLNEI